jgi:hypothetical protein
MWVTLGLKLLGWGQTALAFCLKHWRETAIVLLAVLAYHNFSASQTWEKRADACKIARKADHAAYVAAQKEAEKKNKAEVAAAESKWKDTAERVKVMYDIRLQDAYRNVAAYAKRMLESTTSPASGGDVSSTTDTSGVPLGAGAGTLIPVPAGDLNVCAANTVKAKQWQEYWKGVVAGWPRKLP